MVPPATSNGGDTLDITNGIIGENSTDSDGGGAYNAGALTLTVGKISRNTASSNGGAVQNKRNSALTLTDNTGKRQHGRHRRRRHLQ